MKWNTWRLLSCALIVVCVVSGSGCRGRIPIPRGLPKVPSFKPPAFEPPAFKPPAFKPPVPEVPPVGKVGPLAGKPGELPFERSPVGEVPLRRPSAPPEGPGGLPRVPRPPLTSHPIHGHPVAEEVDLLAERANNLERIPALREKKDWQGLHQTLETELKVPGLPAALLQEMQALDIHVQCLAACEAVLRQPGGGLPTGFELLPEPVQKEVRALLSLKDLKAALGKPWKAAPDVAELRRELSAVEKVADEKLTRHIRLHLALRAEAEGHLAVARELLPSAEELEKGGPELRDLKAVLPEPRVPPKGPPSPSDLPKPEGPQAGTRPGVKESLRADLPRLKAEVEATEEQTVARVRKDLETQRAGHEASLAQGLSRILVFSRQGREQQRKKEKQEQDQAEAVAKQLGRPLTGPERTLVGAMVGQGKSPAEIAKILNQLR
jgi:hypothetical protein